MCDDKINSKDYLQYKLDFLKSETEAIQTILQKYDQISTAIKAFTIALAIGLGGACTQIFDNKATWWHVAGMALLCFIVFCILMSIEERYRYYQEKCKSRMSLITYFLNGAFLSTFDEDEKVKKAMNNNEFKLTDVINNAINKDNEDNEDITKKIDENFIPISDPMNICIKEKEGVVPKPPGHDNKWWSIFCICKHWNIWKPYNMCLDAIFYAFVLLLPIIIAIIMIPCPQNQEHYKYIFALSVGIVLITIILICCKLMKMRKSKK